MPVLKPAHQLVAPQTETTTLNNGMHIVSQETYGQATTLGLFIDAGSRYETSETRGASHMAQHLSFKSTRNTSHAQFVRELERIGGTNTATASREQIVFTIDMLSGHTKRGMELLADSVLHPLLREEELQAIRTILAIDIESQSEDPSAIVHERIHEAAYGSDSNMGRSIFAPKDRIGALNADVMQQYMNQFFVGPRMVLAGSGIEHEKLVDMASKAFKDIPKQIGNISTIPSTYVGGQVMLQSEKKLDWSYAAMAFECDGWNGKDLVSICVLQTLLGGGDSFSAGGPGKGMYSRLYLTVLNRYYWIESATAFTSIHADGGLIGIYSAADPQNTHNMIAVMINQFVALATSPVQEEELQRAKNQLKSSVLMNLESRLILNEDLGRQVLTYGAREDPLDVCRKIDAITSSDLLRVAQRAIQSEPSLMYYGDENLFPQQHQVRMALQEGYAKGLQAAAGQ